MFAQTIDGIKFSDLKVKYLSFVIANKSYGGKYFIALDYGQKTKRRGRDCVKDSLGNDLPYNSTIHFVNKMDSLGYKLYSTDANTVYYLKRKNPFRK